MASYSAISSWIECHAWIKCDDRTLETDLLYNKEKSLTLLSLVHEIAARGTDDKVSNFPEHYHEKSTVETVRYSQTNGYKQISSAAQSAAQSLI